MTTVEALRRAGPRASTVGRRWAVLRIVVLLLIVGALIAGLMATANYVPYIVVALRNTILAAIVSAALAVPIGIVLCLARMSSIRAIAIPGAVAIEFLRGVPLMVVLVIVVLVLPALGLSMPLLWRLCIPVALCNAAVLAESLRAAVRAVPREQSEMAATQGATSMQINRLVVWPQASLIAGPLAINQFVIIVKDTTLGFVVSYAELMQGARVLVAQTGDLLGPYALAASIYIALNLSLAALANMLARRFSHSKGPAALARVQVR